MFAIDMEIRSIDRWEYQVVFDIQTPDTTGANQRQSKSADLKPYDPLYQGRFSLAKIKT
jgi:hypothetical protein